MNKKILIIVISLMLVLLLGGGMILLSNNNNNENNNFDFNNEVKTEKVSDDFYFIYNLNAISEEWWNSPNKTWKSFGYTNKDVYNLRYESVIGNIDGKLKISPVDYSAYSTIGYESLSIKSERYLLSVKNNSFLYPSPIKILDDDIGYESSMMDFYVLGSDCYFYKFALNVIEKPSSVELIENEWTVIEEEGEYYIGTYAYYPINSDYCLFINFFPFIREDIWNTLNDEEKEKVRAEKPWDEKDIRELIEKTTGAISFKKVDYKGKNAISVEMNDIKLDDETTILISSMEMALWNSGADNTIFAYNAGGELVGITEHSKTKNIDYFLSNAIGIKEYNYEGRSIYITYYPEETLVSEFKGNYIGIILECDGILYQLDAANSVNPNEIEVNTWINNLCDGIISFE